MEQKSQLTQSKIEQIECIICYELPKVPQRAKCCGKIVCYEHKIALQNKCPNCRNSPFETINDTDLYKQVLKCKVLEIQKDKTPLDCQFKNCSYVGTYSNFAQHYQVNHGVKVTDQHILMYLKEQDKQDALKFKQKFQENRQPKHGIRKIATQEQNQQMMQHVQQCNNEKCYRLWSGPWGPFIGGEQGRTHFDLTECQVGKQLNQAINWDYDNPAF